MNWIHKFLFILAMWRVLSFLVPTIVGYNVSQVGVGISCFFNTLAAIASVWIFPTTWSLVAICSFGTLALVEIMILVQSTVNANVYRFIHLIVGVVNIWQFLLFNKII
jgi:hypothetical protein